MQLDCLVKFKDIDRIKYIIFWLLYKKFVCKSKLNNIP